MIGMYQKRNWTRGIMLGVFLFCVLMTTSACNGGGTEKGEIPQSTAGEKVDWMEKGFRVKDDLVSEESRYIQEFMKWEHAPKDVKEKNLHHIDSGIKEDCFWYLGTQMGTDGNIVLGDRGKYILDVYPTNDEKRYSLMFTPRDVGVESELGLFAGMEIWEDGRFLLRWAEYGKCGEDNSMYRQCADVFILTDLSGNNSILDFYDIFMREQFEEYRETILPLMPSAKFYTCAHEGICIANMGTNGESYACIYDFYGNRIAEILPETKQVLKEPFRNEKGELILPVSDDKTKEISFYWANIGEKTFQCIGTMPDPNRQVTQFLGMSGNQVYYQCREDVSIGVKTGVVSWNVETGERKWVLSLDINDLPKYKSWWVFRDGDIKAFLLSSWKEDGTRQWIVPVTKDKVSAQDNIIIAGITSDSELLRKAASLASMENPGAAYLYENDTSEDAQNKIRIQLSQNAGPDIMLVSRQDFYDLNEKGLLMDLNDLLDQETRQDLLPGALGLGHYDEKLTGIPINVHIETMILGKDVEEVSKWDLETVIWMMEQGKLKKAIWSPYIMKSYLPPLMTMSILIGNSFENSFLIDWKGKKSYFNDERFVKLLEMTQKDESKTSRDEKQQNDITWVSIMDYLSLIELMADYEQEGRIVGFPGQTMGTSVFVPQDGILVVNKNAKDTEAVKLFLETILSKEMQNNNGTVGISVRKFQPQEYITTDDSSGKEMKYYFGKYDVDKSMEWILRKTRF